jgi:hypothetical protein
MSSSSSSSSNPGAGVWQHEPETTQNEAGAPQPIVPQIAHNNEDAHPDWFGAFHVPLGVDDNAAHDIERRLQELNWFDADDSTVTESSTDRLLKNCVSCFAEAEDLHELSCEHVWCRDCLVARIELAMEWEGNWPAKCCMKIDEDEMRALAEFVDEDEVVLRYLGKYEEMETPRDQRIYCANQRCSVFLGQRREEAKLVGCVKCNAESCLLCGAEEGLHGDGRECPSEKTRESHAELIKAGKLQQCPGCPEVVELREACHHITYVTLDIFQFLLTSSRCLCGTEFCFSCGAFWRTCYCPLYPGREDDSNRREEEDEDPAEADPALAAARATCLHPIFNNATRRTRCDYCGRRSRARMYKCARCRTAACYDCYDRLNMFMVSASALRQEAALRAEMEREDELGD